jgi:hypothetical protein
MKQSEDKFIKAEFKNLHEVLAIVEEVKKVQQRCARPNPEVVWYIYLVICWICMPQGLIIIIK